MLTYVTYGSLRPYHSLSLMGQRLTGTHYPECTVSRYCGCGTISQSNEYEDGLNGIDEAMTDTIISAVDLIDGLAERLESNFEALVNGSAQFGQTFPNVLQSVAEHFIHIIDIHID